MFGLTFDVEGIYFCCFRQPTTTSLILSFSIPPFTTIRGFLENALGYRRDTFALQNENLLIGIRPLGKIERNTELAKILKLKEEKRWMICKNCNAWYLLDLSKNQIVSGIKNRKIFGIGKNAKNFECMFCKSNKFEKRSYFVKNFGNVSSPMFKNFLVEPKYRIYLVGEKNLIDKISEKLENPERPLYLGQSDDIVDVNNVKLVNVEKTQNNKIWSIIEGVHNGCEIVKLPYRFINNGKDVEMKVFSVPEKLPFELKEKIECFKFGEKYIKCY